MWKMWKSAGHERRRKKKSSSPSYDHGEGGIYPLSYGESHGSESKVIDISIVQRTITSYLVGELNIN